MSEIFDLDHLLAKKLQAGKSYLEFLRAPAISAGIYTLPAGATDPQKPHTEDEIYYVISGKANNRDAHHDANADQNAYADDDRQDTRGRS